MKCKVVVWDETENNRHIDFEITPLWVVAHRVFCNRNEIEVHVLPKETIHLEFGKDESWVTIEVVAGIR